MTQHHKEYVFVGSGIVLFVLSIVLFYYFRIDPIDEGLIVGE